MCNMLRDLDIILFGATSFTGKHCIPILNKLAKANGRSLKWGIAGRSEDKLKSTLSEVKDDLEGTPIEDIPIIVANVQHEETLLKMAKKTHIIINCVGPFSLYGEPVVKACIEQSTHHVDISSEPQYMEKMQLKYHKLVEEKGVYIVSACGFSSIPSDLGVKYIQEKFEGTLNSVKILIEIGNENDSIREISVNTGTWESIVHVLRHYNILKTIREIWYSIKLTFSETLKHIGLGKHMVLPFPWSDTSVIQRSQAHFYKTEGKHPVQVSTYFLQRSLFNIIILAIFGIILLLLSKFKSGRNILLKYPSFFSLGVFNKNPSEEKIRKSRFSMIFYGEGWKKKIPEPGSLCKTPVNKAIIARIKAYNPAYGFTNIALTLSAIMILTETDKLPGKGGVFPPGAAFANTSMIKQLMDNRTIIEIISEKDL